MFRQVICAFAVVGLLAGCASDEGASNGAGGAYGQQGAGAPGAGAYGANGYGAGQAAPGSQEDLVQTVGDRIFFATDRSSLDDQARQTLDRQAAWLQRYPQVNVVIAGNCDERGTEEYNLALGQRRAATDRDYLVAHGVAANRIQTISYGKDRPTDAASTPEAWAKNRNAITYVR
ncbi:MAG TPA: peptidoglycan-associated lipoprotein Pal [Acetobacteraceae bacterium]|nr:peptidoglycan-associated lipoprotein Pal [Acetobacteraceae bacterium]